MVPANITSIILMHLFLLLPFNLPNDLTVLLIGGVCAFLLAYLFTFGVIAICRKVGWLDKPEARRIHKHAVPRLGGIAMFQAFVLVSLVFYAPDPIIPSRELVSYWLLLAASLLFVLVHAYDDV